MIIHSTAPVSQLRSTNPAPPQSPPPPSPSSAPPQDNVDPLRAAVALAAPVVGGAAGIYAGLGTGSIPFLIGALLIPGAAIGGAVLGGVLAEKLFHEESTTVGVAVMCGLLGGAAGIRQAVLAGNVSSPWLAASMGLSGAVAGLTFAIGALDTES